MAKKLIVKGKVVSNFPPNETRFMLREYYLMVSKREWWGLGQWAEPYLGQIISIFLEETNESEAAFLGLKSLLESSLKKTEGKPLMFTAEEIDKSIRVICEVEPLMHQADHYEREGSRLLREARKLRVEAERLEKEIWE